MILFSPAWRANQWQVQSRRKLVAPDTLSNASPDWLRRCKRPIELLLGGLLLQAAFFAVLHGDGRRAGKSPDKSH
jgi:hypothetical protein